MIISFSGPQVSFLRETAGEQSEKSKQVSREELRKQVRDFVKWLKAQGVI